MTSNTTGLIRGGITRHARRTARAAAERVHGRRSRPWVGSIGAPLAFVAAALDSQWILLPLLLACMWWWAARDWGWEWLAAVQAGAVGVEWALIGASCLAHFPEQRLLTGTLWAGSAGALALLGAYNRATVRAGTDRPSRHGQRRGPQGLT